MAFVVEFMPAALSFVTVDSRRASIIHRSDLVDECPAECLVISLYERLSCSMFPAYVLRAPNFNRTQFTGSVSIQLIREWIFMHNRWTPPVTGQKPFS